MIIKPVIACVTAFNEEKTIGRVLDVLKECSQIDRIQVVDDGSTDNTNNNCVNKGITPITIKNRVPIGEAIQYHLKETPDKDCTLLWCDADLINFKLKHIETILANLEKNDVSMSIGVKDNFPFLPIRLTTVFPLWTIKIFTRLNTFFNMHVGGERAIHKSIFEKSIHKSRTYPKTGHARLPTAGQVGPKSSKPEGSRPGWEGQTGISDGDMALQRNDVQSLHSRLKPVNSLGIGSKISRGYGIVILLNWYCKKFGRGYTAELLPGLSHRNKYQKWGVLSAFEIPWEIFQFVSSYVILCIKIRLNGFFN